MGRAEGLTVATEEKTLPDKIPSLIRGSEGSRTSQKQHLTSVKPMPPGDAIGIRMRALT